MLRGDPRTPTLRNLLAALTVGCIAVLFPIGAIHAAPEAEGTWSWPVAGPVVRAFDPPETPFGSGHRGIDIAAPVGTPVQAPDSGMVKFAGKVGGHLFVSIVHAGGLESTYSWLSSISVRKGDVVFEGMVVATTGPGAAADPIPNLHFGAKRDGAYVDPLSLLEPLSLAGLIRLAPLAPPSV